MKASPLTAPALCAAAQRLTYQETSRVFTSSTFAAQLAEPAKAPELAKAPEPAKAPEASSAPLDEKPFVEADAENVVMHPSMARSEMHPPADDQPTLGNPASAGGKFADSYMLMHPVYTKEYVEGVRATHKPPVKIHEKVGYYGVQLLRRAFDAATGYGSEMNERKWLARFLYLETVAGVPGMVSGMLRHLRSLRTMQRDNGWIHTLLEEAENERMHLLTFMQLRQPGILFRAAVLGGQAFFFNFYCIAYTLSPKSCHAFVGYLEEEATKTYTRAIQDLDDGKLPQWTHLTAPDIGKKYWRLAPDATMRDLLLAVRADEACHMHVNHTFSHLDKDAPNPFQPGSVHVP